MCPSLNWLTVVKRWVISISQTYQRQVVRTQSNHLDWEGEGLREDQEVWEQVLDLQNSHMPHVSVTFSSHNNSVEWSLVRWRDRCFKWIIHLFKATQLAIGEVGFWVMIQLHSQWFNCLYFSITILPLFSTPTLFPCPKTEGDLC